VMLLRCLGALRTLVHWVVCHLVWVAAWMCGRGWMEAACWMVWCCLLGRRALGLVMVARVTLVLRCVRAAPLVCLRCVLLRLICLLLRLVCVVGMRQLCLMSRQRLRVCLACVGRPTVMVCTRRLMLW